MKKELSIWFFVGALTLVYGLVLMVQGVVDLRHPPSTVLADLHPTLWWGGVLTIFGGVYVGRFRPRRR